MRHSQVVVIGGGAVGASCLYHLTLHGIRDCILLEKDELTSGSTWHAAGNIPTYANSWLGMRTGNYAWALYKDLEKTVDSPITYRHTGAFWPAHTAERMDWYAHLAGLAVSAGYDLQIISPKEMEQLHPFYHAGDSVLGAMHDPYEGDIDPSQLTQALAKGARDAGATVERFCEVTAIRQQPNGEWQIDTNKGAFCCEVVVNATGFYGNQIANMIGQSLPIATLEHQYLVTEKLDKIESHKALFPLVRDPEIQFYLRREGAGFLFGSYGHAGRLAFKDNLPKSFSYSLFEDSPDDIAGLLEQAVEHVPLLAEAGVKRFVNGPIAYSPDALPLCGPAAGVKNFYHATGIQIGITHSAAAGKAIAEWISQGETEWDYASWDPRRFGDWATKAYAESRIVELYGLQYAIPYPHRLLQSARPLKQTSLYTTLSQQGAVFGQIGGWERAFWFKPNSSEYIDRLSLRNDEPWRLAVANECQGVQQHVGVMDHGGFTKFEVRGTNARKFLQRIFCGTIPPPGRVSLSYMLTPQGRVWSEATIACISPTHFLLCGPTLAEQRDFDWLQQHQQEHDDVDLKKGSPMDATLLLMGPKARSLLATLTDHDLSQDAMPWFSVNEINIAGVPCLAMRISYVGEFGWELHLEDKHLTTLYNALQQKGTAFNLVQFGSYALNSMRLEKTYHAWGADFGVEYTLFDAGLERFVDDNNPDFIGREAVLEQRQQQADWTFVRLTVEASHADPMAGDPILLGDRVIGFVSSGGFGFRTQQAIALGYVQKHIDLDQDLTIRVLGTDCQASMTTGAIYDPSNLRLKLS